MATRILRQILRRAISARSTHGVTCLRSEAAANKFANSALTSLCLGATEQKERLFTAASWTRTKGFGLADLSEPGPSDQVLQDVTASSGRVDVFRTPRDTLLTLWQLQHVPGRPRSDACDDASRAGVPAGTHQASPTVLYADSVRRKRKHKMNKHKHRKRLKKLRHKSK